MQANTFDVIERHKHITFFKLGKLWVFKQFFDNHELFNALLDYYNKDLFRFEFKYIGSRNNALKLLEKNGFDYDLVEDFKGYVILTWQPSRRRWAWARKSMRAQASSDHAELNSFSLGMASMVLADSPMDIPCFIAFMSGVQI
jgi:hypothetical protein